MESRCNVNVFIEYLRLCHLCLLFFDFLLKVVTLGLQAMAELLLTITFHLVIFDIV